MVSIRGSIGLVLAAIAALIVIMYRKEIGETGTSFGAGLSNLAGGLGDIITKPGIALADVGGRLLGLVPGIPATPALPFGGIPAPPGAITPDSPVFGGNVRADSIDEMAPPVSTGGGVYPQGNYGRGFRPQNGNVPTGGVGLGPGGRMYGPSMAIGTGKRNVGTPLGAFRRTAPVSEGIFTKSLSLGGQRAVTTLIRDTSTGRQKQFTLRPASLQKLLTRQRARR